MTTMPVSFDTRAFAFPWQPDQRDGTYRNPILFADYSDPDLLRDGADFYMTASSFNCTPGLPILHSRDLVNWRLINHALKNMPHARYAEVQPGCGCWAPSIRKHADKFWIFMPTPDEGIYVLTADHPAGQWSEPHLLLAGKGLIDPCPLWDDNGQAYLVHAYANSRAGIKNKLRVRPMSPDARTVLGEGTLIYDDPIRHPTAEGPKFYKLNGRYYILAPGGGVATGWQVAFRSDHVYGPYEDRIVLERGNTPVNGPHQGGLVDTPDGSWWFVHFQEWKPYGRIVHLQPVEWRDGWPWMGERVGDLQQPVMKFRKPVAGGKQEEPQTNDEFDAGKLGLQWQWQANHEEGWCSLSERSGWLRLKALPAHATDFGLTRNLLLQKFPAAVFGAETLVEVTGEASGGLVVAGVASAAIRLRGNRVELVIENAVVFERVVESGRVRLRVNVGADARCTFGYAEEGKEWVDLPREFVATEGKWIGAKVGVVCVGESGHADFDYFRFS